MSWIVIQVHLRYYNKGVIDAKLEEGKREGI
jgi:hypothetical protein